MEVAEAVQAMFSAMPKTGKPQPHESTVLAGESACLFCSSACCALCTCTAVAS